MGRHLRRPLIANLTDRIMWTFMQGYVKEVCLAVFSLAFSGAAPAAATAAAAAGGVDQMSYHLFCLFEYIDMRPLVTFSLCFTGRGGGEGPNRG